MNNYLNLKNYVLIVLLLMGILPGKSQEVPEHISNSGIYTFLDELATDKIITLNSVVKPYTKAFIHEKLMEASEKDSLLNKRQQKDLFFYWKEFQVWGDKKENPYMDEKINFLKPYSNHSAASFSQLGYIYKDTTFTFVAKPIWGVNYATNDFGNVKHFYGGLRTTGKIGKHIAFYANIRDNSISQIMAWPGNLTRQDAGNYKLGEGGRDGGDYSEMRGGISLNWNWGYVSLVKDHVQWGDNYNGPNILDSRAPSFATIKLHMNPAKWFEFDYIHGWLVSEDIDSTLSYRTEFGEYRAVMRPQNIAANMFTFHPWQGMNFSFGNSIVYSDLGGAHPAYLIPFAFYKSIDHTVNHDIQNQNSQMFVNISTRNIKHLHLYGTLFVDEFKKSRINVDTLHNFLSWKGGFRLSNWPVRNISIGYEYTTTTPLTYKHRVKATEYMTNNIGLGHYLYDNSSEHYFSASFKPISRLQFNISYLNAIHGKEYQYNVNNAQPVDALDYLVETTWQNKTFALSASYELLNNVYLKVKYEDSDIQGFDVDNQTAQHYLDLYTPEFYQGHQQTIWVQFNIGF